LCLGGYFYLKNEKPKFNEPNNLDGWINLCNEDLNFLEELEKAANEGKGAAQLDGRMIDAASARMAENIVNIDKLINK